MYRFFIPAGRSSAPVRLYATSFLWVAFVFLVNFNLQAETLRFNVRDPAGDLLPCRIHLLNEAGEPQRSAGNPFWHDHFVCSGQATIELEPGRYSWQVERGPEWTKLSGKLEVTVPRKSGKPAEPIELVLSRISNLRSKGWYGADLHVHRSVQDIELLMQAEDLDFAPVIGWWNMPSKNPVPVDRTEFQFDGHRIYSIMAGEDEREGGALLFFGLKQPLDLSVKTREIPSPMKFVKEAKQLNPSVWIDIEKPFWWDMPTWVASGSMRSIGIANNHMCRKEMLANEAWGKPRDTARLPGPRGNGLWSQEIYYHLLNSGFRLPPSAGSASGVLPNPVGYNRVYVQLAETPLSRDAWFNGLAQGRCFVTNRPLIEVQANQTLPGEVLNLPDDSLTVSLDIKLASNDPVEAVEIIVNGQVIQKLSCTNATQQTLNATVVLDEPGWFLVRAICDVEETFRFASTAPWYVEAADGKRRMSSGSIQFFLAWVNERIERLEANVAEEPQGAAVMSWHLKAHDFWMERLEAANVQ